MGESTSTVIDVEMGVAQGSTLAPSFFMYINDMHNALASMDVMHFVVDFNIYMRFNKNVNISDHINSELNSVNDWLSATKLYLNSNKTKYMIFSNKYKTSTEI